MGTIPRVRELVIVAADLYFAPEGANSVAGPELPHLAHVARFGQGETLPRGWRGWIAGRLSGEQLAHAPAAAVAAAGLLPTGTAAGDRTARAAQVWLATPVHLTVSLRGVHLDPHGLLRLDAAAQARLAESFGAHFGEHGHGLLPASGGGFVAYGPRIEGITRTIDPARCLGASLTEAQPTGPGGPRLQRLSAEIEMWLHEHPLNVERLHAGEPPVSALWLWGGASAEERLTLANPPETSGPAAWLFGDDPYLAGLASLTRTASGPAPATLAAGVACPRGMTVIVVEVFGERARAGMPQAALEAFEHDFVAPALRAVRSGAVDLLRLVANDRALTLRQRDRLRLWRRRRGALEALQ